MARHLLAGKSLSAPEPVTMKSILRSQLALLASLLLLPLWATAQSVVDLAVGESHFCTLDDAGIVSCTTSPSTTRLLEPAGLPALTDIAAGEAHTCGITLDGGAVCWGGNDFNQLDVPPLNAALVSISAGFHHTCAVDTEGEAICWGLNTNLQLEPPATENGFIGVDGSSFFSCGIRAEGDITCWSTGASLANPSSSGPFTEIDLSIGDNCGLTVDGDISCFRFVNSPTLSNGPYMDLAVTRGAICGLTLEGRLDCELQPFFPDEISTEIATISESITFTAIESGHRVRGAPFSAIPICGVREDDGSVLCFGGGQIPETASNARNTAADIDLSLSALAYDSNAVELFWNRQANQFPQIFIEIFRDGELLTTTDAMFSFFDTDTVTTSESTYSIRATDEFGNLSAFSNEITVSRENIGMVDSSTDEGLVNPRADNDLRIENLTISAPNFFGSNPFGTTILNWDLLDDSDGPVAGYEIRQNDETIAFTRDNQYIVNPVSRDFCGVFSVLAIGDEGQIIESASISLHTNRGFTCP